MCVMLVPTFPAPSEPVCHLNFTITQQVQVRTISGWRTVVVVLPLPGKETEAESGKVG